MKILYALNAGNPGGVEQHVLDLAKGMIEKGHEVFVWCLEGQIVEWYKQAGAQVTLCKINFEVDLTYILKLANFVKKNKINVVHAHELKAGVNAMLGAKLGGAKVITNIHTPMSEWRTPNALKAFYTKIEIVFYSLMVNMFSNFEIALTPSRKQLKAKEGVSTTKLVVIPNCVDQNKFNVNEQTKLQYRQAILNKFSIPSNALIIGHVGRMTEEKGHAVLLDSFSKLLNTDKNDRSLYLLFAGGGRLEQELKQKSKELQIERNVIFYGIFNQEDIVKIYSTFDVFVFPSLAEGFGLVLLEAMTSALPVVASDLEVLQEVGGSDVSYFKSGYAQDLANKIYALLEKSDEERKEVGRKLRERALNNYTKEKFVDNYLKLYESTITR